MIFTPITITILNFAQQVVTSTIGTNIGLNNIFQQITASLNSLRIILDKNQAGGGIDDLNIKTGGITSVSTNLTMETVQQVGSVTTGNAPVEHNNNFINTTITTQKPNQKVHITWGAYGEPVQNGLVSGSPNSRVDLFVEFSTSPTFATALLYVFVSQVKELSQIPSNSGAFLGTMVSKSQVITLPTAGTYYVRLKGGHSGNLQQITRVRDGFITYIFN